MQPKNTVKLGDIAKVISGYAFKSVDFKEGGPVPVLKIKNIKVGTASLHEAGNVRSEFLTKLADKFHVLPGDILISLTGSHMSQPNSVVGRVGRYPKRFPKALLNQRAGKIILDTEKVDSSFLFYALFQDDVRREIAQMAAGAASQANVSPSQVESIELPLPDLDIQKSLGNVFESYDNLIENNNRRIAILEDMAQSLYREWFVKFRYPGHQNQTLIDSPIGPIPEGWEVKQINDFGTVVTGKTPSKKKPEYYERRDVPFIKTPDMHDGIFVIDTTEMLSQSGADSQKNKLLPLGSISVSCIGTAGVVAINAEPAQTNQQINSVIMNNARDREFLYFSLVELKQTIINYGSTGATMTNLSKGKFESLKIVTPPKQLVLEYNLYVRGMFNKILVLLRKNKNLVSQRDMLLPKLISGKINLAKE